ncbi:hypothetical protein Pcac1_g5758 [Phytophthora cactorum]|nr:hypothetical protein Pcac1_g5758 [Phytophthora cactorum]
MVARYVRIRDNVKLQSEDLTLADVRTLFNSVGQRFPSLKVKLSAPASIVHSPTFEATVVKVINGEVARLTTSERRAVKRFEVSAATTNAGSKRKQRDEEEKTLEEDFASSVLRAKKYMLGYLRKRMTAETLETILFLKMNWDLVTNEITPS